MLALVWTELEVPQAMAGALVEEVNQVQVVFASLHWVELVELGARIANFDAVEGIAGAADAFQSAAGG